MPKGRTVLGRAGRTCRAGVEGVARGGRGRRRCGRASGRRSLDGRLVVSPQEAHAGRLLLGLLGLLLLDQHLLVQDQLNVLLSEVERIHSQVQVQVQVQCGRFSTVSWGEYTQ